jgi:hypothetical protein
MDIVPRVYSKNILRCPKFLYNAFERGSSGVGPSRVGSRFGGDGRGYRIG